MDADHFAPKYEALLRHLQKHAKRCRFVHECATFCDRGTLAVVNSKHILETGLDYDNFERADADLWNRPDFVNSRIQRGDVLTYMTGANIGRTAAYLEDTAALASNEVNMLRVENENAIYVALALNSLIGRMQTRRACTGSAQVHLYPSNIKSFLVPFVDAPTQAQIVADVESAHAARRRAKQLLEATIESDEAAGMKILQS